MSWYGNLKSMAGANHKMESVFLDTLPHKLRPASIELLHNYDLKDMLIYSKQGVPPVLQKEFELTTSQWLQTLDKVILTKVSYFMLTPLMSLEHIDLLEKVIGHAMHQPNIDLKQAKLRLGHTHLFFGDWLTNIIAIKQYKLTYLKNKAK